MSEPITRSAQNSPIQSSGNMLCDDLSAGPQCVNRSSLGYPPSPHYHQLSSFGARAPSPTNPSSMASMRAPDRNDQIFLSMDPVTSGYYADPPPMYPPSLPRPPYHYPLANSGLVADVYHTFVPTYQLPPDAPLDFGGIYSEPVAAHQPPTPPAAPEQSTLPNPAFYFHPCRWLSGPPCDGFAPGKNREMGEHLRLFHRFVGYERDVVQCQWESCGYTLQRMNVPRHIVSRHLLAAASCRFCSKRFSRPDVVSRHERTCGGNPPVPNGSVSRV